MKDESSMIGMNVLTEKKKVLRTQTQNALLYVCARTVVRFHYEGRFKNQGFFSDLDCFTSLKYHFVCSFVLYSGQLHVLQITDI